MKTTNPKLWIHLFIVIAMLSLLMVGCEKETEEASPSPTIEETSTPAPTDEPSPTASATPTSQETQTPTPTIEPTPTASPTPEFEYPDEPPRLPPSFGLDTDVFSALPDITPISQAFEEGDVLASIGLPGQERLHAQAVWGDQSYWNHASGNVLIWSTIIVVGLAVPVAAFAAAFDNIPYKEGAATWVWSYDIRIKGKRHTAELYGTYIPNGVKWEMHISKDGAYIDFLWYYGESDMAGTEGYWIMKENPSNPNDLLQIDWERDPGAGTNEIKYENIKPGAPENGGYILARVTGQTPYDSAWDIYNKGKDNHTFIEWNRSTEEGRVKDFNKFKDNEWHCWGSNHKNLNECP